MKGHKVNGGPSSEPYKMEMQKKGITIPEKAQNPSPMTANPVTHVSPGLGGRDLPHPFRHGKPTI